MPLPPLHIFFCFLQPQFMYSVSIKWASFSCLLHFSAQNATCSCNTLILCITSSLKVSCRNRDWKMARRRRTLGSRRPADRLDSTHICLNNPENRRKTSRTVSLEPSIDKRPTEEGRNSGEAGLVTLTGGKEPGQWRGSLPSKTECLKSDLQKQRGQTP